VPAVLLLTGLIVLGLSGLRGTPASAVATPTPPSASQPAVVATPSPRATATPTRAPGTVEPTVAPSSAPTVAATPAPTKTTTPGESFRTYTVRNGDTLSAIASKFGTTSRAIADLNGIKTSTILHAGDVLKIPNT
jgi:LysM repeat protein